jgi:3-phytase
LKDLLEQGLLTWLAAGAAALTALVVLALALFSPRTDSSLDPPQFAGGTGSPTPFGEVTATVETEPVPHPSDAADDVAIWVHPTDASLSTVLGTDKLDGGGLGVYDLDGQELYFYADGNLNNVDLRYNFPLGAARVSLVGVTNRADPPSLIFYTVNAEDRSLSRAGEVALSAMAIEEPRGLAMYHSAISGKYYAFVTEFGTNVVHQLELNGASGSVTAAIVRSFDVGETTEGVVADDDLQRLYVSEEDVGVWRYGAEPGEGDTRTMVDSVIGAGGHLTPSIKGTAIYYRSDGGGYLLVSSEGAGNFLVYDRVDNAYLGSFQVRAGSDIDAVTGQDGIDVMNLPLGDGFPEGLFVSQDHVNTDGGNGNSGNQNFKYVPWQLIANDFDFPLTTDTRFDRRLVGAQP